MFHFKRFCPIYKCKNSFPSCVPHLDPRGPIICTSLKLNISVSFHVNIWVILGQWFSRKKKLNYLAKFLHFVIISPLKRTWPFIWTIQNSFYPRIICTKFDWNWPAGSGEDFFLYINTSEYGFPYCGPSRPPGTMIWRNLNLHYIRKLSCKYDLFWLIGSWKDFQVTPPHFCIFAIISHLKRTWSLIWTV
jgi:hypothetical protein